MGALLAAGDPSEGTGVRAAGGSLLAIAILGIVAAACNEQQNQPKATRTLTATVTLTSEDILAIDSAVTLKIHGEPRIDEIYATLDATVTASTSTRAEQIASKLSIDVTRSNNTVTIKIPIPTETILQGELRLRVPSDLKIDAIERGDHVDIDGMEDDLRVFSESSVRIIGAQHDVNVGVNHGNAILETELDPGSRIELATNSGDLQLTVPISISADVIALVKTNGTIVTNHPQLPPFRGQPGQAYHVRIGDGLSSVSLQTGVGNIVIGVR